MKFNNLYELLLRAASDSSAVNDVQILDSAIQNSGMTKIAAEDDRFVEMNTAYEARDGEERLFVQYRYYDTSGPFSIQPDMNVYLFRHTSGSKVISEKQIKFLDKG